MKKLLIVPFIGILAALALPGCSQPPSGGAQQAALDALVTKESSGLIRVTSYHKNNAVAGNSQGISFYDVTYTATIEFIGSCYWGSGIPKRWLGHFTAIPAAQIDDAGSWGSASRNSYAAKNRMGDTVTITATARFTKTENGWVASVGEDDSPTFSADGTPSFPDASVGTNSIATTEPKPAAKLANKGALMAGSWIFAIDQETPFYIGNVLRFNDDGSFVNYCLGETDLVEIHGTWSPKGDSYILATSYEDPATHKKYDDKGETTVEEITPWTAKITFPLSPEEAQKTGNKTATMQLARVGAYKGPALEGRWSTPGGTLTFLKEGRAFKGTNPTPSTDHFAWVIRDGEFCLYQLRTQTPTIVASITAFNPDKSLEIKTKSGPVRFTKE